MAKPRNELRDRVLDGGARALLRGLGALPYDRRIPAAGALFRTAIGPATGWAARARKNLAAALPDLPAAERARIAREVCDNVGRSIAEMYAGDDFLARVARLPLTGDGAEALIAARDAGRPVVGVTAHFGNYNAARGAIIGHGLDMGSLYKPMRNPLFNAHYEDAMAALGGPMFPRNRRGVAAMIRHLRTGGMVALLADLHVGDGVPIPFFGRPAMTALTAAELANRYGALLVPFHGIRAPDGMGFTVRIGPEAPPGEPEARMRWLTADLEALVRAHPAQWFWIHRRWKAASGAARRR